MSVSRAFGIWAWIVAAGIALSVCVGAPAHARVFEAAACGPDAPAGARCGHVRVPENYAARDGRTIALNVLVLPAIGGNPGHQAQFELEGGPGIAVTTTAGFYATDGAIYRAHRDIVFFDMRGTGGSNPLRCPEIERTHAADRWAPVYPAELVAQCYDDLSNQSELSQYNTANAVRDLEAVRAALGYRRITLNALSYGTTLALAYIAEYPRRVRAAVLTGVAPADKTPPRYHADAGSKALVALMRACRADSPCHAAFSRLEEEFTQARDMANEHRDIFMERLRAKLYAASSARRVPLIIHHAASGDFSDFEVAPADASPAIADGLYLSITCAESFPYFAIDDARAEARTTPFNDYRLRQQAAACVAWPVPPNTPPSPKASQTPVLFISGEFDPVTPPEWVDALLPLFPNARHVVLPGGGHVVEGMSDLDTCLDPLVVRFLDTADAKNLDATCIARMHAPAFVTR